MSTLSERYGWAVARLLPEHQRDEVRRELDELIGEMIDSTGRSEREVLAELGDPGRMAARYVERPRALIGAEVFPEYVRTLKVVAGIAVPAIVGVSVLGAVLDADPNVGDVVGAALGTAYTVAIQVAFWVTLVYAFADRWKAESPWTPDSLPDLPSSELRGAAPAAGIGEIVFGIVITVLVAVAIVWQQVWPPIRHEGDGVPILHPDLWNGPGQAYLGVLAVSVAVQLVVLRHRRWTIPLAAVNAVANAASFVLLAWLAFDERLVNPEFLRVLAEQADWDTVPSVNPWIPVVAIAGVELWDSVEAFLNARRAERATLAAAV